MSHLIKAFSWIVGLSVWFGIGYLLAWVFTYLTGSTDSWPIFASFWALSPALLICNAPTKDSFHAIAHILWLFPVAATFASALCSFLGFSSQSQIIFEFRFAVLPIVAGIVFVLGMLSDGVADSIEESIFDYIVCPIEEFFDKLVSSKKTSA